MSVREWGYSCRIVFADESFALARTLALVIALTTIGLQALKAAMTNH